MASRPNSLGIFLVPAPRNMQPWSTGKSSHLLERRHRQKFMMKMSSALRTRSLTTSLGRTVLSPAPSILMSVSTVRDFATESFGRTTMSSPWNMCFRMKRLNALFLRVHDASLNLVPKNGPTALTAMCGSGFTGDNRLAAE